MKHSTLLCADFKMAILVRVIWTLILYNEDFHVIIHIILQYYLQVTSYHTTQVYIFYRRLVTVNFLLFLWIGFEVPFFILILHLFTTCKIFRIHSLLHGMPIIQKPVWDIGFPAICPSCSWICKRYRLIMHLGEEFFLSLL